MLLSIETLQKELKYRFIPMRTPTDQSERGHKKTAATLTMAAAEEYRGEIR
jgi:hypothetical protein